MADREVVLEDRADYDTLYRAQSARVLRLCRLLLADPEEAREVQQEVFLKLFQALARQPGQVNWSAWLTRVAVNACHDRRRSGWWKWWSSHEPVEDATISSPAPSPEAAAVGKATRARIWESFQTLSERQREVFVLRHLEGCTTDDVARALGMSAGSVKRHLFRAVRQLRRRLEGERGGSA
jgi:RNA polymerase sigma-70 factor (ECF subfamily)